MSGAETSEWQHCRWMSQSKWHDKVFQRLDLARYKSPATSAEMRSIVPGNCFTVSKQGEDDYSNHLRNVTALIWCYSFP
jgi:hypothetical protein